MEWLPAGPPSDAALGEGARRVRAKRPPLCQLVLQRRTVCVAGLCLCLCLCLRLFLHSHKCCDLHSLTRLPTASMWPPVGDGHDELRQRLREHTPLGQEQKLQLVRQKLRERETLFLQQFQEFDRSGEWPRCRCCIKPTRLCPATCFPTWQRASAQQPATHPQLSQSTTNASARPSAWCRRPAGPGHCAFLLEVHVRAAAAVAAGPQ